MYDHFQKAVKHSQVKTGLTLGRYWRYYESVDWAPYDLLERSPVIAELPKYIPGAQPPALKAVGWFVCPFEHHQPSCVRHAVELKKTVFYSTFAMVNLQGRARLPLP